MVGDENEHTQHDQDQSYRNAPKLLIGKELPHHLYSDFHVLLRRTSRDIDLRGGWAIYEPKEQSGDNYSYSRRTSAVPPSEVLASDAIPYAFVGRREQAVQTIRGFGSVKARSNAPLHVMNAELSAIANQYIEQFAVLGRILHPLSAARATIDYPTHTNLFHTQAPPSHSRQAAAAHRVPLTP